LEAIARSLNDIPIADVMSLLVGLLMDGQLEGHIDRVAGVLYKEKEGRLPDSNKMAAVEDDAAGSLLQKCQAMDNLLGMLGSLHTELTLRVKDDSGDSRSRGGMVH
jgi:hypothetical protein